ncbi:MAG: polysaccharide deacetylase [Flavipsychrobacter sp.]|jgi:peptidoglycan/xylan/chitin deacetylase (PgdA/CDA1 family)|nr:polysaccharide deacetylase [Flavipsychrobacter sp.]
MAVPGIPVLNYHAIDDTDAHLSSANVSVSLQAFTEQVQWLHKEGYTSVTKDELREVVLKGKKIHDKKVLFTFDDGYYSLYKYGMGILSEYGFTATLFLSTSFVGKPYDQDDFAFVKHDRQLTWEEIKVLSKNGWSIQSHGYLHKRLNSLDKETLIKEVTLSKSIIEQNLGTVVDEFAFPYGIYTNQVLTELKNAGYQLGYSVHSGKLMPHARRYRLPRIEINNRDTMDSYITKVTTGYISPENERRSKMRDIIYASPVVKDLIEKITPYFGVGNH